MSLNQTSKTIAAGQTGAVIGDLVFFEGSPATVMVKLSAGGTCPIEYTVDKEEDVRADPDAAVIDWIDWGEGNPVDTTPVVGILNAPITALRFRPSGANAIVKVCELVNR